MNERIKELEKQCWSHRVNGRLVDGQLHFDTQKFAELIVRECINQCAHAPDVSEDWYQGVKWVANEIAQHFGVEE